MIMKHSSCLSIIISFLLKANSVIPEKSCPSHMEEVGFPDFVDKKSPGVPDSFQVKIFYSWIITKPPPGNQKFRIYQSNCLLGLNFRKKKANELASGIPDFFFFVRRTGILYGRRAQYIWNSTLMGYCTLASF